MNFTRKRLKQLKPILGAKAETIWKLYQVSDFKKRQELENLIDILAAKNLKTFETDALLEPIPKNLCFGDFYAGDVTYLDKKLYPYYLRKTDLSMHLGLFGVSGCGKTNAAYTLINELIKKNKPFLILDWKRNFRDLLAVDDFKDKLLIFTLGGEKNNFTFNPLIPPKNVDPKVWLNLLIEIICHAYFAGEGVMHILRNSIDQAYKDFGIYSGNKVYPTFKDVVTYMDKNFKRRGRKLLWMDTSDRVTNSLLFKGGLGNIVNVSKLEEQISLEELIKKNVVLELDNLVNADKVFIIEALLLWIYQYKLQSRKRNKLENVLLIEEAHNILRKSLGKESIIELMFRQLRELGTGIIYITQNISKIPITALQNTFTVIAFNQRHKTELETVAKILLLDKNDKELLGKLRIGEAIIKGRYENAFTVKFPLFPVKKGIISDFEIREQMKGYYRYFRENKPANGKKEVIPAFSEKAISDKERIFLLDIIKNPVSSITKRYKSLALNNRVGNVIKNNLVAKGLVIVKEISTRKGRVKLLALTQKGKEVLSRLGVKEKYLVRNSIEHKFWKNQIAHYFMNKGCKVFEEKDNVDLIVENKDKRVAVEIETGKSDYMRNIEKNLNKGFHRIISIFINREDMDKAQDLLKKKGWDNDKKIIIAHINEFY